MGDTHIEELLAANTAFYDAFEMRDIDAMSAVWEHSGRVICTHPGWTPIHGWTKVAATWYTLFSNSERLQFVVTGQVAHAQGDVGWVSCEEDLLESEVSGRVVAFNMFVRDGAEWLMIAHIAGTAPL